MRGSHIVVALTILLIATLSYVFPLPSLYSSTFIGFYNGNVSTGLVGNLTSEGIHVYNCSQYKVCLPCNNYIPSNTIVIVGADYKVIAVVSGDTTISQVNKGLHDYNGSIVVVENGGIDYTNKTVYTKLSQCIKNNIIIHCPLHDPTYPYRVIGYTATGLSALLLIAILCRLKCKLI